MANYIGKMWSSLKGLDDRGGMNIVSGEEAIAEQIVTFLLTRLGEDPFNPNWGLDARIFANLNEFDADLWAFSIKSILYESIAGISGINVRVSIEPIEGRAQINIDYITDLNSSARTLTFPYHVYAGLQQGDVSIEEFIDSIAFSGRNFTGLSR